MRRRFALYFLFLLTFLVTTSSYGFVRYVDPNPNNSLAYHSAQAAHDAANVGDTIYANGGSLGSLTCTKRLVWIGPGYFLTNRPGTQANTEPAKIFNQLVFSTGAANSVMSGFYIEPQTAITPILVLCNNITIQRCYISLATDLYPLLTIGPAINGFTLEQCYCPSSYIQIYTGADNILIRNNYLNAISMGDGTLTGGIAIYNNTIGIALLRSTVSFSNNILTAYTNNAINGANCFNNVCVQAGLLTGNGNVSGVLAASLFLGLLPDDSAYLLAQNSPARGAGFGGVDCGMYGGATPYVLSGLPSIPSISQISAPDVGTPAAGLPITIQATAHP